MTIAVVVSLTLHALLLPLLIALYVKTRRIDGILQVAARHLPRAYKNVDAILDLAVAAELYARLSHGKLSVQR